MKSNSRDDALAEAVRTVRARVGADPTIALILGSGLGDLAEAVEDACAVPTADIPHYPGSTVAGHSGRLVFGRLEDHEVVIVQGRAHLYEGHSLQDVVFPVQLVRALGARRLLVTNAAGGIHPRLRPGTLMFITDHLNMVFESPVRARARAPRPPGSVRHSPGSAAGPSRSDARLSNSVHPPAGSGAPLSDRAYPPPGTGARLSGRVHLSGNAPRPPRNAHPYDPGWLEAAERISLELGIRTERGVYVWTRGPSYETKAEIAAFRRLGGDAVGMSTVPEVLVAAEEGMTVLGISSITNPAAGLSKVPLSHEDVLQVGRSARVDLERLVRGILRDLG